MNPSKLEKKILRQCIGIIPYRQSIREGTYVEVNSGNQRRPFSFSLIPFKFGSSYAKSIGGICFQRFCRLARKLLWNLNILRSFLSLLLRNARQKGEFQAHKTSRE